MLKNRQIFFSRVLFATTARPGFAMGDVVCLRTLVLVRSWTRFAKNASGVFGIMAAEYLDVPFAIVSFAKTINSSIKHLAKFLKQKVSNVRIPRIPRIFSKCFWKFSNASGFFWLF